VLVVVVAGCPLPLQLPPEEAWKVAERLAARGLPVAIRRPCLRPSPWPATV